MKKIKTKILISLAILAVVLTVAFIIAGKKAGWFEKSAVYEALVQIRDEKAGDPAEDARSSLKAGDVIAVLPEGHKWSETEETSYLILKIKLTPEDAAKLTEPETKEIEKGEKGIKGETEEGGEMGSRTDSAGSLRVETIRARAYRLKIETLNFDLEKFWRTHNQPYPDKIFTEDLIQKK